MAAVTFMIKSSLFITLSTVSYAGGSLRTEIHFMNLFEIGWMISKTNDIYVTIVNGPFALFLVEVRSYDDPMKTMAE